MGKNFYRDKNVFITGGNGFIGSHIVDKLIALGAKTTVAIRPATHNLSDIQRVWKNHNLRMHETSKGFSSRNGHSMKFVDLNRADELQKALKNHEIVFHFAAVIGGRGFINTHPADCCGSFSMNQNIIKTAYDVGVDRLFFSSSACVYPVDLQKDYNTDYLLTEKDAFHNNWANADMEYGWAKLMGEMTLRAFHQQYGFKSSIARLISVYGPGAKDTHAIIALINRALRKEDPYIIWGNGEQKRDFTYIDDVVNGVLNACEFITDATPVNLGTEVRYSINEVTEMIFDVLNWHPKKIKYDKSKPEGSKSRALDCTRATKLLHWKPNIELREGLEKTISYFKNPTASY